jgi:hypothetical protein
MEIMAKRHFAYYQRVGVSLGEAVNHSFCKIILPQRLWLLITTSLTAGSHSQK